MYAQIENLSSKCDEVFYTSISLLNDLIINAKEKYYHENQTHKHNQIKKIY